MTEPSYTLDLAKLTAANDPTRGAIGIEQDAALRAMRAAGVKAPRPCGCDQTVFDEDLDGDRRCILCGRAKP